MKFVSVLILTINFLSNEGHKINRCEVGIISIHITKPVLSLPAEYFNALHVMEQSLFVGCM